MKRLRVAVGVVTQGDSVLLARRQAGQHLAGCWEFPGGKIEAGETLARALVRELAEEVGLSISLSPNLTPWQIIEHDYPNKQVRLEFVHVPLLERGGYGREGQSVIWHPVARLHELRLPEANRAIVDMIREKYCGSESSVSETQWG